MRPTLNVISDELIAKILGEARRIMAETGMEIRGEDLRNRLLDHGLKTDANGRVLNGFGSEAIRDTAVPAFGANRAARFSKRTALRLFSPVWVSGMATKVISRVNRAMPMDARNGGP